MPIDRLICRSGRLLRPRMQRMLRREWQMKTHIKERLMLLKLREMLNKISRKKRRKMNKKD